MRGATSWRPSNEPSCRFCHKKAKRTNTRKIHAFRAKHGQTSARHEWRRFTRCHVRGALLVASNLKENLVSVQQAMREGKHTLILLRFRRERVQLRPVSQPRTRQFSWSGGCDFLWDCSRTTALYYTAIRIPPHETTATVPCNCAAITLMTHLESQDPLRDIHGEKRGVRFSSVRLPFLCAISPVPS
jgi:hypothetical protein